MCHWSRGQSALDFTRAEQKCPNPSKFVTDEERFSCDIVDDTNDQTAAAIIEARQSGLVGGGVRVMANSFLNHISTGGGE
jgi:hypothetical protein